MADRIDATTFRAAGGVGDWQAHDDMVTASFRTRSFSRGVDLIVEVGREADAADHHPDVDLRFGTVTFHLTTHDTGGLTQRDIDLARRISEIARRMGIDPVVVG
jgi:4a-hydroxytetrahydrobiopterin dehydratase